jgi:hypothetical protein
MRLQRSEARRSNLRASTLKTDAEIEEREKAEKVVTHRKGRVAMHKGGEARGVRHFTQAELIAEALEEEERNKEELQKWLRREEERRELRRVGRKRVKGPRWTWISRTVGKIVEVVGDGDGAVTKTVEVSQAKGEGKADGPTVLQSGTTPPASTSGVTAGPEHAPTVPVETAGSAPLHAEETSTTTDTPTMSATAPAAPAVSPDGVATVQAGTEDASTLEPQAVQAAQAPPEASSSRLPNPAAAENLQVAPPPTLQGASTPGPALEPSQYMRNYIILSQVPGGLPAELALILGSHVDWDQVKYIPSRARPINRRRPRCPFTGKIAKYRHPATMIPYADVGGYQQIEALLKNRYLWSDGAFWLGGEEDLAAPEAEEIEGWREAMHGGWMGGLPIPQDEVEDPPEEAEVEVEEEILAEPVKKGRKRMSEAAPAEAGVKAPKGKKRRRG